MKIQVQVDICLDQLLVLKLLQFKENTQINSTNILVQVGMTLTEKMMTFQSLNPLNSDKIEKHEYYRLFDMNNLIILHLINFRTKCTFIETK